MKKFITFPENFWWGAATSGPQSEGSFDKPHENIMDYWYHTEPHAFFDGIGPNIASDFYHHYKQDFVMLKEIGCNSFRTSIQWSRLIKNFETGEPDQKAIAFYKDMIAEAKKNDITLIMNLHHFDMPLELLQTYGGWESKHVVELFVKFAKTAFVHFGASIAYWTTFNEPMVIPEAGYLYGFHYPNYKGKGKEAIQIIYNLNLANAKVIQLYRSMNLAGNIGIILNLTPAYPRSDLKEDVEASHFVDNLFNRSFLDPAVKGTFPKDLQDVLKKDGVLWHSNEVEQTLIKNATVDFLGVNYYHPKRVKGQEHPQHEEEPWRPDRYFEEYEMPGCRMNPYRKWEIYPKAIYDIAMNLKLHYDNIPWFISENGMGVEGESRFSDKDGYIQDDYRIAFYEEHLAWLAKAIQNGSSCFGYHTWTAFDCWSWNNAYKNRYGFIAVDLKTQNRTIKKSGYWYRKLSQQNGFTYDLKE